MKRPAAAEMEGPATKQRIVSFTPVRALEKGLDTLSPVERAAMMSATILAFDFATMPESLYTAFRTGETYSYRGAIEYSFGGRTWCTTSYRPDSHDTVGCAYAPRIAPASVYERSAECSRERHV